jgi:glucokinase
VDSRDLAKELGLSKTALVNDLAANALGISELLPADFAVLNHGDEDREGNGALISAGTGLGEAILVREEKATASGRFRPLPSEGGHASFAPRDAHEVKLLKFLMGRFGHVSAERVLSGPGLANVYAFEREDSGAPEPAWLSEEIRQAGDPAPVVTAAALSGKDAVAQTALTRFVRIYGSEAGNLALKALAMGGVFVGGGIAPKILPVLQESFFGPFCDKGRLSPVLSRMPIKVILNDACALLGAARAAVNA